ncbi:MAG: hypothetical protein SOW25_02895 [Helicobacter sp.]|nr:hypothetical protein [Helicobacteraceae bacterium]MDY3113258.1 hypothetical protein [Helicobacter sp.]
MYKIQCQNIKCNGCINKINQALLEKYPSLKIDLNTQIIEVETSKEGLMEIKTKLQELGFFKGGILNKIKNFLTK